MPKTKKENGKMWEVKYRESHTGYEKTINVRAREKDFAKEQTIKTIPVTIQILSCQLTKDRLNKKKSKYQAKGKSKWKS